MQAIGDIVELQSLQCRIHEAGARVCKHNYSCSIKTSSLQAPCTSALLTQAPGKSGGELCDKSQASSIVVSKPSLCHMHIIHICMYVACSKFKWRSSYGTTSKV